MGPDIFLEADPCKGCMTSDRCVVIKDEYPYIDIVRNSSLEDFILKLLEKIEDLENRIRILELLNG